MAGKSGLSSEATPTPDPSPQGGGEKKAPPGARIETKLTKRVRALYEGSAVPVREIARLAGVTERTIYKYVARHGWTKRYRTTPRSKPPEMFAPVKGPGGRFIRREDHDKPVATGLKATDPAGARRASARCGAAAQRGAEALAEADEEQKHDEALQFINGQLKQLESYLAEPRRQALRADVSDLMRDRYLRNLVIGFEMLESIR